MNSKPQALNPGGGKRLTPQDEFDALWSSSTLSRRQLLIWLGQKRHGESPIYSTPFLWTISGAVDPARLERAFQMVVDSNEALRTVIEEVDGVPRHRYLPRLDAAVEFVDFSADDDPEASLRSWLVERARRVLDLGRCLFDCALVKLSESRFTWYLNEHHLITDGWSKRLVFEQTEAVYRQLASGSMGSTPVENTPAESNPGPSFAAFIEAERKTLETAAARQAKRHWERFVETPFELLRAGDGVLASSSADVCISHDLESGRLRRLREASGGDGDDLSLFSVFGTLLLAFLHRAFGQRHVAIGTTVGNRLSSEARRTIGLCLEVVPLGVTIADDETFSSLLLKVKRGVFETLRYRQHTPLNVPPQRVFDVMLNLLNLRYEAFDGAPVATEWVRPGCLENSLELHLLDFGADQLRLEFHFRRDEFEEAQRERLVSEFLRVFDAFLDHGEEPVGSVHLAVDVEPDAPEERPSTDWPAISGEYPLGRTVAELFMEQARSTPDATALVAGSTRLTYRTLASSAATLARELRELGVGPDVPVGICMERSPEMLVALLGTLCAGGAYVPMDPAYPRERLEFVIEDCRAPVVVTQAHLSERVPQHRARVVHLDGVRQASPEDAVEHDGVVHTQLRPQNLAYVIYTSGSTGTPKGVAVEHRSVVNLLSWFQRLLGPENLAGVLASTSINFDISVPEIFAPLCAGGHLILVRDALAVTELAATSEVRVINTVPSAMAELVRLRAIPDSVRTVILAGEPLRRRLADAVYEKKSIARVLNLYGPTEATVYATGVEVSCDDTEEPTIGRPITNTSAHVLDASLEPVSRGVAGELYLGGCGLARGYLHRAELTSGSFIESPLAPGERLYRTGDRARVLPNGHLEFLGRVDHQVKVRGFRIELGEIETALGGHPRIREVAVLAPEDADGEKQLVAYFVAADGAGTGASAASGAPSSREIERFLEDRLPEHMIPRHAVELDALPLTPNGKVDRKDLLEREVPSPETGDAVSVPRSRTEEVLAEIWRDLLSLEQVGIHDSFFELGGHSLRVTRMVSRIHKVLGVELPLRVVFEAPTIAELSQHVDALEKVSVESTLRATDRGGDFPLSFSQQRHWFLEQMDPGASTYNVGWATRLAGPLDATVLQRCLDEICARHGVFRTAFLMVDGHPVQRLEATARIELSILRLDESSRSRREALLQRMVDDAVDDPFRFDEVPLARATLIEVVPDDHVFVLVAHHIISDAWSLDVLGAELSSLYPAIAGGGTPSLQSLPSQYVDFAVAECEVLQEGTMRGQFDYWKEQLAGVPSVLELPTDRPRPAEETYCGGVHRCCLTPEVAASLKELARRERSTLFMAVLAAFYAFLHRLTGARDLVVGTPISGRNSVETEALFGCFLNTLALRVDCSGDLTFRDLMSRVRAVALEAFEQSDVPFEKLIEELQPERSLSHSPIFQVMFVLQHFGESPIRLPGVSARAISITRRTSKFPLTLFVNERPDELELEFEYNTDLFDASTVERMSKSIQNLVESVVRNPQERIDSLRLLEPEDEKRVLARSGVQSSYPREWCVHDLFAEQLERTPDATAVVQDGRQLSYRELDVRASLLARQLIERGIEPDSRVGLCIDRSMETVVAMLGILKAGGAYVPFDPEHPAERVRSMLDEVQPDAIVTCERFVGRFPGREECCVCVDAPAVSPSALHDSVAEGVSLPATGVGPEHLAYVLYTSGSTGRPKGIAMPHRPLVNLITYHQRHPRLGEPAVTLQFASPTFDVSFQDIFTTWCTGGTVVIVSEDVRRDPDALLRFIDAHGIERLFLPFVMLRELAAPAVGGRGFPRSVRDVICAGETLELTPEIRALFQDLPECRLHNHYGPTESHVATTFTLPPSAQSWPAVAPIGTPLPNVRVYVLGPYRELVPPGTPGELCIGGEQLARGYLGRPELTAERFVDDPFRPGERLYRTGDRARWLDDGSLEFLGRTDHQVKLRGYRVELGEVEVVLKEHPAVSECVVVVREEGSGDQGLVAYCVSSGGTLPGRQQLRTALGHRLPGYMVPGEFVELSALPVTSSGKVDRAALPLAGSGRPVLETGYAAPSGALEEELSRVWAEVLGVERVGVHDNFFDLGGHSLLAVRLLARLESALGRRLPLAVIFQHPTIHALVTAHGERASSRRQATIVPLQPEGTQTPLFFLPSMTGEVFSYVSLLESLGSDQPVYGFHGYDEGGAMEPFESIEEMAGCFAQGLSRFHDGPVRIAGFSFGGIAGFELARQLRQAGREVEFLGVLDTGFSAYGERSLGNIALNMGYFLRNLPYAFYDEVFGRQSQPFARRFTRRGKALRQRFAGSHRDGGGRRELQLEGVLDVEKLPQRLRRNATAHLRAFLNYQPEGYDGRVTVFRARRRPLFHSFKPDLGWGRFAGGGVDVHVVPGNHTSMLRPPHVAVLGERLRACLDGLV